MEIFFFLFLWDNFCLSESLFGVQVLFRRNPYLGLDLATHANKGLVHLLRQVSLTKVKFDPASINSTDRVPGTLYVSVINKIYFLDVSLRC
jgi:hypothetical protein